MKAGVLTAFFVRRDEARRALKELSRKGFRRAALIHKAADGRVHTLNPFHRRRALGAILAGVVLGGLAGAASFVRLPFTGPLGSLPPLAAFAAAGALGALLAVVWMRSSVYGVERRLLVDHERRLASEETVLILQAPIHFMGQPVAILRQAGERPPAIFVLNPKRVGPTEDTKSLGVPLAPIQIQEHAKRAAAESRLAAEPRRTTLLLDRMKQARKWVRLLCSDLSNAAGLEQRTPPIAEWILDNEYIIQGTIRDIRQNLSPRFYRKLPSLEIKRYRDLPRVYQLAKEARGSRRPSRGHREHHGLCGCVSERLRPDHR